MTENEIWRTLSHELNTDGTESMRHIRFAPQAIKLARGSTTGFGFESHLWMPTGSKSVTKVMLTDVQEFKYLRVLIRKGVGGEFREPSESATRDGTSDIFSGYVERVGMATVKSTLTQTRSLEGVVVYWRYALDSERG